MAPDERERLFTVLRRCTLYGDYARFFDVPDGTYATLDGTHYEVWDWPTNPPKTRIEKFHFAFGSVSLKIPAGK